MNPRTVAAGNYVRNRVSTARSMLATPGGLGDTLKTRGLRYTVGSMGGSYGLTARSGHSLHSSQRFDQAFLARGGKRIAGVIAAGAAVGGMRNRTSSGLTKGRTGMTRY
jgi:hypothetical protein